MTPLSSPISSLFQWSKRAGPVALYWLSRPQEKARQWLDACSSVWKNPEDGALQTFSDLTRLGLPKGAPGKRALREALEMCVSNEKGLPALRVIVEAGLFKDASIGEGLTPLALAFYWQNKGAALLLAPLSSFGSRPLIHSGDEESHSLHARPLSLACDSLDPECVELCLEWMSAADIVEQTPCAFKTLISAETLASERFEAGLGATLDTSGRGVHKTPAMDRLEQAARAISQRLEPADAHALIDRWPEVSNNSASESAGLMRSIVESRCLFEASAGRNEQPVATRSRARL